MKYKTICLLAILFCCSLAATPNRCTCNGLQCAEKQKTHQRVRVTKPAVMMIDETELLPIHRFFNNF